MEHLALNDVIAGISFTVVYYYTKRIYVIAIHLYDVCLQSIMMYIYSQYNVNFRRSICFYINQFIISKSDLGAIVQNSFGITIIEEKKLMDFLFYLGKNGKK